MAIEGDMHRFPGFEHIYHLNDPLSNRQFRGSFDCGEDCLAVMRGEARVTSGVRVSWAMGGETPSDVIWTTSAHPIIVHHRVLELLRAVKCSGWQAYPVEIQDRLGNIRGDYYGLVILGRCNAVDLSRSIVVLSHYPNGWYPHILGTYFPEESWDGTDLFMERVDAAGRVTATIYATEKLQKLLENAGVKNVRLERLTETNVPTSVFEIGSSHLLPPDFEDRVALAYARAGVPRPE